MEENNKNLIKEFNVKKYRAMKFVSSDPNDKACNLLCF